MGNCMAIVMLIAIAITFHIQLNLEEVNFNWIKSNTQMVKFFSSSLTIIYWSAYHRNSYIMRLLLIALSSFGLIIVYWNFYHGKAKTQWLWQSPTVRQNRL